MTHVVRRAYTDTGALGRRCPACGAAPGRFCTRRDPSGIAVQRRVPCLARCSNPTPADVIAFPTPASRSFSEPLRGQDDTEDPQ